MVEEPYTSNLPQPVCYQAGGNLLPLPAADGRNAAVDGENGTDRDVNMMLDEPSSGSISTTYFACSQLQRRQSHLLLQRQCPQRYRVFQCGFQFFISEQVEFLLNLACTFSAPLAPRISTSPALLICDG